MGNTSYNYVLSYILTHAIQIMNFHYQSHKQEKEEQNSLSKCFNAIFIIPKTLRPGICKFMIHTR